MKPEQFIREFGPNIFKISMSFVNTAKYLVVHEGEIDFTDEIKPHHGDRVFERDVVKRLVESLDLLKYLGGYERTKARLQMARKNGTTFGIDHLRWQQAIRDHESIYGGGDE
jgi:hypothetical protein